MPAQPDFSLPASLPGFELAAAQDRLGGNGRLHAELLLRFVAEHADGTTAVCASLRALRPAEAVAALHRLKGAARIVGAHAVAEAAARAEDDVSHGGTQSLDALHDALCDAIASISVHVAVAPAQQDAPAVLDVDRALADVAAALRTHDASAMDAIRQLRHASRHELPPEQLVTLEQHLSRFDFERAREALDEIVVARRHAGVR